MVQVGSDFARATESPRTSSSQPLTILWWRIILLFLGLPRCAGHHGLTDINAFGALALPLPHSVDLLFTDIDLTRGEELARARNGPCCVKSLSDRHVAGLLLLFVVSAGLPHHAVREETASPSKARDPLSRVLTALLTALPLPSPATGPQGSGADLALLQTCSSFRSTPQRPPGPSGMSCHSPTCGAR